jgi:hypothetical protein
MIFQIIKEYSKRYFSSLPKRREKELGPGEGDEKRNLPRWINYKEQSGPFPPLAFVPRPNLSIHRTRRVPQICERGVCSLSIFSPLFSKRPI